ncbi:MAG TPA: hypothetical protein VGJ70_23315 [Solirubrobacteraceae bacterium]
MDHRLVTEAEHRLRGERSAGRVQLWAGEPAGPGDVRRETAAEVVRVAWTQLHGPPDDVHAALVREGLALALSASPGEPLSPDEREAVRDALAVVGAGRAPADVLGVAYGDPLAEALGWAPMGLPDRGGCRYAAELATGWLAELGPAGALRRPPAPLPCGPNR